MTAGSLAQLPFLWNRLSRHREPGRSMLLGPQSGVVLRYRWVLSASQVAGCQGIFELKVDNCLIS